MRRRHLSNKMEGAATPPQIKSQVVLIEITLNLRLCKDSETRPISDGFKKNNVNYWVFRDLCSIILHS